MIVDLRSAIRKELEFGKDVIDQDREKAWIGRLNKEDEATVANPKETSKCLSKN